MESSGLKKLPGTCDPCPVSGSKFARVVGIINVDAILLSLLPIIYGSLILFYGERIWDQPGGLYDTAMGIPYAPESVGVVFVVLGLFMATLNFINKQRSGRLLAAACFIAGVFFFMFSISFVGDAVHGDEMQALPPLAVNIVIAALYANKARLAWTVWHR